MFTYNTLTLPLRHDRSNRLYDAVSPSASFMTFLCLSILTYYYADLASAVHQPIVVIYDFGQINAQC